MKKPLKMGKSTIAIVVLSVGLLASLIAMISILVSGVKAKDGINGKDAKISIDENGEVIVDDEKTGIFATKADYEVTLKTEGNEYGKVVGGGKFASGQTVSIQAIPTKDGCFKGWKNNEGEIVSYEEKYSFIASKGKLELTGVFEKSNIEIYFETSINNGSYFENNNFSVKINNGEKGYVVKADRYGNRYYTLSAPAIFKYGEEVIFEFDSFEAPSYEYKCYMCETNGLSYENNGSTIKRTDITNGMSYSFKIDENKKYYFRFEIEANILVTRVPTIEVSSNNEEYGTVSKTECLDIGDVVTLTANEKASGTEDYIYKFKGWYLNNKLVSSDYVYSFAVNEYYYGFEARFVKKYALKFEIKITDKETYDDKLEPTSYYVTYKNIKINSFDTLGNKNTITFNGNYNGSAPDLTTKTCGYFEIGEKIFLSNEIESAHESYYVIDERDNTKEYKEKFVYTKWILKDKQSFALGNSAMFMLNEEMDLTNLIINVELFVLHTGDTIGD